MVTLRSRCQVFQSKARAPTTPTRYLSMIVTYTYRIRESSAADVCKAVTRYPLRRCHQRSFCSSLQQAPTLNSRYISNSQSPHHKISTLFLRHINSRSFDAFGSHGTPLRSYCMQPAVEFVPVDPLQLYISCPPIGSLAASATSRRQLVGRDMEVRIGLSFWKMTGFDCCEGNGKTGVGVGQVEGTAIKIDMTWKNRDNQALEATHSEAINADHQLYVRSPGYHCFARETNFILPCLRCADRDCAVHACLLEANSMPNSSATAFWMRI